MKTILLTGVAGFLGSHIAEELVKKGFRVIGLKKNGSDIWRCHDFKDKIQWIDSEDLNVAEFQIINANPDILIHAAWNGVKASDRDNRPEQEENISFLVSLFDIIKKTNISKIIALGSQAEYGSYDGIVDETHEVNPNTVYGVTKVKASEMLKVFAEQNKLEWYWLRSFSIFGPKEDASWLIPSTINNLVDKKEMALTLGEQRYDYLFSKDFAGGVLKVVECKNDFSGIYNFSSNNSLKIKEILIAIETRLSPDRKLLLFGKLTYRNNQVMHMQGNSERFYKTFNFQPKYSMNDGLKETIDYYLDKIKAK